MNQQATKLKISKTFNTTQSDLLQHNGKPFTIVRSKTYKEYDAEDVGPMFIIKLSTGETIEAFEDEIFIMPEVENDLNHPYYKLNNGTKVSIL